MRTCRRSQRAEFVCSTWRPRQSLLSGKDSSSHGFMWLEPRSTICRMTMACPRVSDLRAPKFGQLDPVLHNLALSLIARAKMLGEDGDSLFVDWIALAFHAHVVRAYGEAPQPKPWRGGLTPRCLRIASDWMIETLAEPLSIPEIARQIDMAPGHFARAFREVMGEPPHKWLMRRRIARAKELLRSPDMSIAEIALICGFVDQSHLTRVFSRTEKLTPAAWRRLDRG